jgi:hypothetical protein
LDKVELLNLVPKFLSFFHQANKPEIDVEKRWSLWKEHYNIAAVPPGDDGKKMARNLLDTAWQNYAEHLSFIEKWEPNEEKVRDYLTKVKALLIIMSQLI